MAIVSLIVVFSAASTVFAQGESPAEEQEWIYDTDDTIYYGEIIYDAHYIPKGQHLNQWNTVTLQRGYNDGTHPRVTGYGKGIDVVFVDSNLKVCYTPRDYDTKIDDYFLRNDGDIFLSDRTFKHGAKYTYEFSIEDRYYIAEKTNVDVTSLVGRLYAKAIRLDDTYTFSVVKGEYYMLDSEIYYVEFAALPNKAFDSDGNISYRGGEIEMMKLTDDEKSVIAAAKSSFKHFSELLFGLNAESNDDREQEESYDHDVFHYQRHFFDTRVVWAFIFGISLPLMIAVLSLVLIIRKKREGYKRLFFVFVPACMWLIAGTIVFFLLI